MAENFEKDNFREARVPKACQFRHLVWAFEKKKGVKKTTIEK